MTPFGLADFDDMLLLKRVVKHQPGSIELPETFSRSFSDFVNALMHPTASLRLGYAEGSRMVRGSSASLGLTLWSQSIRAANVSGADLTAATVRTGC